MREKCWCQAQSRTLSTVLGSPSRTAERTYSRACPENGRCSVPRLLRRLGRRENFDDSIDFANLELRQRRGSDRQLVRDGLALQREGRRMARAAQSPFGGVQPQFA